MSKGKWGHRFKGHDHNAVIAELKSPIYDGPITSLSEEHMDYARRRAKLVHELLECYSVGELAKKTGLHSELIFVLDRVHTRGLLANMKPEPGTDE